MYAESTEDLEGALSDLEECGQENYIKHVKDDLLNKKRGMCKIV